MADIDKAKVLKLFLLLAGLHALVFVLLPFSFTEFNDRVNWFGINAIPWWPLYKLGLPVYRSGWLITPNVLGWAWCLLVWTLFYWFLSKGIIAFADRKRTSNNG